MLIVTIAVIWLLVLALVVALGTAAKAGDDARLRERRTQALRRLGRLSFRAQAARARSRRPPPVA